MNLSTIDLNLLRVLDALLREVHVGRAAARLGLSQPATSHALRRLRALFGDPLLVQTGRRMALSPRAETLRLPLERVLQNVRGLLEPAPFAPQTSRRTFRLMMPDLVSDQIGPLLVERLSSAAPGVHLEIVPWRGIDTLTGDFLSTVDIVISMWTGRYKGFERRSFCIDKDVLAVRRRHPAARSLSRLDGFLAARHVAVVGPGERDDPIDVWLGELGHVRNVVLTVPSYLLALRMVARSDLVAFVPGRLMASVGPGLGVGALRPPIDPGTDALFLHYPSRMAADEASVWLRGVVAEIGQKFIHQNAALRGPHQHA
jgi:DNA-binding transcriptional LysR family regulator